MQDCSASDNPDITRLLRQHRNGDAEALHQLIPQVYQELRRLAQFHLKGNSAGNTLQPTTLVHEAFFRLFNGQQIEWQNRAHFFQIAGKQKRWLVVDHWRQSQAKKRGGAQLTLSLDEIVEPGQAGQRSTDLILLDQALSQLELLHPRVGKVVELRYFVGLTEAQTAEVLAVSARTIRREWAFAKGWLLGQLQ